MKILNLTQHVATAEQREQGVIDLHGESLNQLKGLLTFDEIPTQRELSDRADAVIALALQAREADAEISAVMIGGAPYFMEYLGCTARAEDFQALFAFSKRESVERVKEDGSVEKVAVFRHVGFVRVE